MAIKTNLIFLHIVMLIVYGVNIHHYIDGTYNYDGWRYAYYILGYDVFFLFICAVFNYEIRMFRIKGKLIAMFILQNIVLGIGIEAMPFYGALVSLGSLINLLISKPVKK